MKKHALFGMVAAVLVAAGPALAAAPSTTAGKSTAAQTASSERCTVLMQQFDQEVGTHGKSKMIKQANSLRASGEKECKAGKTTQGVASLEKALKDIGVTPRA